MIKFTNVTYKIKNKVILSNVSFSIKKQEKVLLVGESGSGKSTILNLIARFIKKSSGSIIVDNISIDEMNYFKTLDYRKNIINIISQKDDLFDNLTVFDNLKLFYYEKDIINALTKMHLLHLKDRCVSTLSGGERQRIGIIKASLENGKIILCDEITSALDNENASEIIKFVLDVFFNKTIIFVSHDLSLFDGKINKIIKVEKGRIISNESISKVNETSINSSYIKRKNLFSNAFIVGLKKISFPLFVVYLLSIITFFVCFSFNDIFNYFSKKSYEQYLDYNVLQIVNNNELKENNKDIYVDVSQQLNKTSLFVNNIEIIYKNFKPFDNKDNLSKIVVNDLFLKINNIETINSLKIKINDEVFVFNKINIVHEDNMFSSSSIYYDFRYFNSFYENINIEKYIFVCSSFSFDERFTNNPMYEKNLENKPYLQNNAYQDYLTSKLIFSSIKEIVDYYVVVIFFYSFIVMMLINISNILKDVKQIAIYISKGYGDLQILCFYFISLLVFMILSSFLFFLNNSFIIPYLLSSFVLLVSIIFSYMLIKKRSLLNILKEESI